ncbi:MAG: hypothetical protein EA424_27470, partial [Planctomycetaceae bacterium]
GVVHVVQQQLGSSGIGPCRITLEHNLAGEPPITLNFGDGSCPTFGDSATWPPPSGVYVRVTVFVPSTELAPNLLKFFGWDISQRIVRNATTFRYEL